MSRPLARVSVGRRRSGGHFRPAAPLCRVGAVKAELRCSKERLFGLTNSEANHGADVKEYCFYLASALTHSHIKYLSKYPQAFPYNTLVETSRGRSPPSQRRATWADTNHKAPDSRETEVCR